MGTKRGSAVVKMGRNSCREEQADLEGEEFCSAQNSGQGFSTSRRDVDGALMHDFLYGEDVRLVIANACTTVQCGCTSRHLQRL